MEMKDKVLSLELDIRHLTEEREKVKREKMKEIVKGWSKIFYDQKDIATKEAIEPMLRTMAVDIYNLAQK